jgi:hypothetical protein
MGAERFTVYSDGATAEEAFRAAVDAAEYDYGHSGYTGTIAEKDGFVMVDIRLPVDRDAEELFDAIDACDCGELDPIAVRLLGEEEAKELGEIFSDKWGPALCIHTGENQYVFGGWASC